MTQTLAATTEGVGSVSGSLSVAGSGRKLAGSSKPAKAPRRSSRKRTTVATDVNTDVDSYLGSTVDVIGNFASAQADAYATGKDTYSMTQTVAATREGVGSVSGSMSVAASGRK
jgi:hypothetical protein